MANRRRRRTLSRTRTFSLRQNIYLDTGFLMEELRQPARDLSQDLEAGEGGDAQELIDACRRQDNVYIARDPADVAVPPDGPAAAQDGLDLQGLQKMIERLDYSTITPGQILRFEHGNSSRQELIG